MTTIDNTDADIEGDIHLQGDIDAVQGNSIAGWIFPLGNPDRRIDFNVRINGIRVASGLCADTYRQDLEEAGLGDGRYGFEVDIPWSYSLSEPRHIEIVDRATGVVLLEHVATPAEHVVGYFETVEPNRVAGWLAKWGKDEPVRFDIKVNGTLVAADVVSNLKRADLAEAGVGSGGHAFDARFPQRIHPDDEWLIELVDRSTGATLLSAEGAFERDDAGEDDQDDDGFVAEPAWTRLGSADLPDDTTLQLFRSKSGRSLVMVCQGVPCSVEVWRDGSLFAIHDFTPPTGEMTPEAAGAESTSGLNRIVVIEECDCLVGDGEEVEISLRHEGEVLFEERLETLSAVVGRIDRYKDGALFGWAVDFRSKAPPVLELSINGILYNRFTATRQRDDIADLFGSRHRTTGFEIRINQDLFDDPVLAVSLRIAGFDVNLPSKVPPIPNPREASPGQAIWDGARFGLTAQPPVTIVVPIYNAPDEVEACIQSLLRTVPLGDGRYEVLLLDDTSPDPRITPLLQRYVGIPGLTVVRHEINKGYTGNINIGIRMAGDRDVVLLNSDTEVTDRWLQRLQRAAYRMASIGTVTAVSDNAGAFSVPDRNEKNAVPAWLDRGAYARLVANTSHFVHTVVPTGSGFCLYIKRAVFDDIGLFDEVAFPRGYGEENEFCMRSQTAGWLNTIAEDVLIYHERSASFQESKTDLMALAATKVPEYFPEYPFAVGKAFASNPVMTQFRYEIRKAGLRAGHSPSQRILYVIGVESGGTPQTNMDLMSSIQDEYEPYLLLCSTATLRLFEIRGRERVLVEEIPLADPVTPILHDSRSYTAHVTHLLQAYGIDLVHIRHIGRHGLSLVSVAKSLDIPVIFSLHDFYTVCPNTKLLDGDGVYCGGRCTAGTEKDCNVELWEPRHTPPLKHQWIRSWQKRFGDLLKTCDVLITTSPAARDVVSDIYDIKGTPFEVIPHGRDFSEFGSPLSTSAKPGAPLKVLVPGHMVQSKGLDLVIEIKKLDIDGLIEFHFLGTSAVPLQDYGVVHGKYERADFARHVERIRPDVGFVVSIWPETYSHTLTELWSSGIPVVTSPLGALGERMRKHGGGWIVETLSAQEALELLHALRNDRKRIREEQARVLEWQAGYGQAYSVDIMARQYVQIYRRTLQARVRPETATAEVYVTTLNSARDRAGLMPTAHLEAVIPDMLDGMPHAISRMPAGWLDIPDELPAPRLLVIQHDGADHIPLAQLRAWRRSNPEIPVLLDLLPPFSGRAISDAQRAVFDELVAMATLVVAAGDAPVDATDDSTEEAPLTPAALLPPDRTRWTGDHNRDRLDHEFSQGLSAWVAPHNAPFVDANFQLIDWTALLKTAKSRKVGRVSIVIPVFNDFNMTRRLIETIGASTEGDYEIIVVDNGSKPDYGRRLASLPHSFDNVRVVATGTNLMFAVGCNIGGAHSTGEHILFLNNDMEALAPGWLPPLIAPLNADPTIGIVGGKLVYPDYSIQHAGIVFGSASRFPYHLYKGQPHEAAPVNKSRRFRAITGACLGLRASDWIKLRGFNPIFVNGSEDVDLCLRMKSVLKRDVLYVPESMLMHYESKTPGRGRWNLKNREIFVSIWGDRLSADDRDYYDEDGVTLSGYTTTDGALEEAIRAVTPIIS
jgi:GT2 family glycosyltransferase/glycosyltransferase involved in cell wall biosynthesis